MTIQFSMYKRKCEHPFRISSHMTCPLPLNLVCIIQNLCATFRISPYITCQFLFNLVFIK